MNIEMDWVFVILDQTKDTYIWKQVLICDSMVHKENPWHQIFEFQFSL